MRQVFVATTHIDPRNRLIIEREDEGKEMRCHDRAVTEFVAIVL
jgi:hypothetical protein